MRKGTMVLKVRLVLGILLGQFLLSGLTRCQAPRILDAADLKLAIDKLSVLGSVLYVGAHPDDENSALLAFLAKGKLVRTAYLSMTRGEGGQNLLGPEQGEELGVIRTQELLAARRIDGAEQYFTRAIDFGYSKTSRETLDMWNEQNTLGDVVWVIRKFRPDIIITRFSPTIGGHGNHTASAILAEKAFKESGDPTKFPEQLREVKPWQAKRILFNTARFFDVTLDTATATKLDVGTYSPALGRSFTEIAGISRSNHKTQGFGSLQYRGSNVNYFRYTLGDKPVNDLFDGIDMSWSRVAGSEAIRSLLARIDSTFDCEHPAASLPLLLKAYAALNTMQDGYWVDLKKNELKEVIRGCAGLWMDALAADYTVVPGFSQKITIDALNRSQESFRLDSVVIPYASGSVAGHSVPDNDPYQATMTVTLPEDFPYSIRYWLRAAANKGSYNISNQSSIGMADNEPALSAAFYVSMEGQQLVYNVPVEYRWVDPVRGELYRPFVAIPPVAVNLEEKVYVFPSDEAKEIRLVLKSGMASVHGSVRLRLPDGWSSKPQTISFELKSKNDEKVVSFQVTPSKMAESGSFSAEASVNGRVVDRGLITIDYHHIPPQVMLPPATGKLVRTNLALYGKTVGYVMGAGDEVPTALRQMGYQVTLLSDDDIANRDFSGFDVIIAGVRAYNTRPTLKIYQSRLMDYVKKGGTYIVQYATPIRQEAANLGPYSFDVSRDRVTDEDAQPIFLNPKSPLLSFPNKITGDDFKGWVQERGLYFANTWDPRFDTVISFADPGEKPLSGGLLYAKYGKGYYMYTGFAFFRQLPAGVTGAFRLFSNMMSLGREKRNGKN